MNKHDSERIAGLLELAGYSQVLNIGHADLVVYYTCCVRKSADERFYGQLTSTKYKRGAKIAVGGCLPQKEARSLARFKEIDLVFGTQNLKDLPNLLNNLNGQTLFDTTMLSSFNSDLPSKRESKYKAWVAISRGCNNHCTYCVVPSVRGKETSRTPNQVLAEIIKLKQEGVKEVTLLGQNVNSYGKDLDDNPTFADLLKGASSSGVQRVRFTTSHPKDLSEDLVLVIKQHENICNHIHLPVQAGSDSILKKMGRNYTKNHYLKLLKMIRYHLPEVSITTDIMVGFPTETNADFEETLDLLEKAQFDQAFTFIYSQREGTPAAKIKPQLDYQTKLKRFEALIRLQDSISLEKNKCLEGATQEVLVEGPTKKDKSMLSGRTKTNKLVHFKGHTELEGKVINVRITEAKPYFLIGKIFHPPLTPPPPASAYAAGIGGHGVKGGEH